MFTVLTIKEFLRLPALAAEIANTTCNALNLALLRNVITNEDEHFIDEEIQKLSALMVLMLDHKIDLPPISFLYIYEDFSHLSTRMRVNFEVFNTLVNRDLARMYEEHKNL